ncbi:dihydroneopterin aldolase [Acidovorax sp. DW039]|uniref:dihydroneopterin aldolase n=1 Tax=Acidovorax sp. DW039 TaxID=3095606 RepID=UPI00308AAD77|nr:dihydroneopterin aldolase [Acidovorax sp. DW039]
MNSILLAFGAIDPRLATHCRALSLRQHEVMVRIGVHDFEREAPQRIWFDVDLCVKLDLAPAAQDNISETVDYDFVRNTIFEWVGERHHELQETLCDGICAALLKRQDIHAVRVSTRKPDVYPDCASVGVERVAIKPW